MVESTTEAKKHTSPDPIESGAKEKLIDPGIEPGTFSVELLQLIHFVNET